MAAIPDPPNPGDATPNTGESDNDFAAYTQVVSAMNAGYSLTDINTYASGVDQPGLDQIWNNGQVNLQTPDTGGQEPYGQARDQGNDAINEGAGPVGEAILAAGAGSAVGIVRGAIAGGIVSDEAGTLTIPAMTRAAQLGVVPTTEGLAGRLTPTDLAVERGRQAVQDFLSRRAVRYGLGAAAAEGAYWNPEGR